MSDYFTDMRRIETEHGDYLEPALNQDWPMLTKLEWQLAVLRVDTGIVMTVQPGNHWINGVKLLDQFSYSAMNHGWSPRGFHESWDFINGVKDGAMLAKEQRKNPTGPGVPRARAYEPERWTQPESIVCMDYPNCSREHAGGAGGVPVHPPTGSRISGDEPIPGYPARWTQPNFAPEISSVIRDRIKADGWQAAFQDRVNDMKAELRSITNSRGYRAQDITVLSDKLVTSYE